MERPLLNDPNLPPDAAILKKTLGRSHAAYEALAAGASGAGLEMSWRYYNDGKAWLCKVTHKKKTVFWLSVRDGLFKTGFHFTEKTRGGVAELDIDANIKSTFARAQAVGKLVSLGLDVRKKSQVRDVLTLAEYKKTLR
ncbi:hypothetical protein M2447_001431 [Ereboglobus sp. PH5-10]|uniref:DUF3788 family protein n=1 Tax=Ereboglobus sp. PH5-10 TaxID=2940629 RepID=UPI002404BBB5|nr:DUF3788 family protein [Ereboglobus sp. PH5-10]MDF9827339.1 hypothetical protein [Ereboglobus sp. PH5-10]